MTKLPTGRHTQTIKSARKIKKRYLKNKALRSRVKTYIRKVNEAVKKGEAKDAQNLMPETSSFIDAAATKGAIHKNKASRLKSRLAKKISRTKTEK